ncbi:unnamed protein product [Euphydryas editha]|uniref:Uncharacterized protein n=1 Tax=Euphydryas editha TaxID=104508 RepID=A0AAU9TX98_EUPED|nr:unnamed protein product [Euphydryas editha]
MMMDNGVITNNYEYGDGYMEQEEEWEREGLLDPAWEKQQKKGNYALMCLRENASFRCYLHISYRSMTNALTHPVSSTREECQ